MENHASAAAYVPSFGVLSSRGSSKPTKATHPAGQSSRTDGEQPPRPPLTSSASLPLLPSSDSALPSSASFPSAAPQTMGSSSSSWVPYPTASRQQQQQQQQHMPGGSASARASMRHVASTSALYIPTFASPRMSGGATIPPATARSVAAAPATARPPTRAAAAPSDAAAFFSSCDGGAATSSASADPVDHYPPLSILLQASGAPQVTGKKRGKKKSPSSRNASSSSSLGKALAMDGAAAGASSITTATAMASPAATESEPKHHAPAPEGWRPHSDADDYSGTDKKASPPPSAASLEQELRRLLSSSTTTTAAAVGMPDSVPVLIPQEEMKFIFATLTWNVDLLLILLSNAPNPVELTERREEAEAAALRDMAAAETERKKRHREHTAAPRQPSAPHRSPPLGERSSFPGNNRNSHNNTTVDSVNQIDSAINENNTAWDVLSPPLHPQQQRQPATWRERLTRRQEDTDEGSEDGESDLARQKQQQQQEQHLRAVMSLPTLSDLEKLTALSPSMRPAVFEARRHQQLDTIARANANHGSIYAGWDTHNLLSLSTQTGGDSGGHNPRQPFSLENINANEDEEADAERPASSQCPNSPFHPSTTSETSVATATTATFPSSTGTGRRHPLRSLCGVDPQYFPTLEEVQQWLEKDGVHASAASLWRRLQDRRRAAAAGGGGGGRGNTAAATPQREDGWSSRDFDESRAGSVRSDVTGGDRVRRNRTFCFAAAASAATRDVDGNDGDDDDERRKATAQTRQGDQQRPQRGRPPRLLPILTSAPISPSVSVSCSPVTMSPVTSYPKLSEMTESPRATDSLTSYSSLTPQKQRQQQQQQQRPSPTGTETVLRRHPSAESLLSLFSSSANVGGGGGVQHQSSRRGGKKKARGTRRRHTTGRTMKIHVSSITEGPKAHLLYTAPTAEADQLYEQLLRLRQQQQQQQQQSCEEVGRPRTTHATSSPIAPPAAAGATVAANKKREEQAQPMSAVAGWPSRASADSSITSGSGSCGETVENKRRRVMALLMRSAESLRFQPWEIPSSLLHPSPPPPVAGSTDNDPKPPSVLSKPTAPSSSPSFLSGAKLAFGSAYTPGATPSCAAAATTTTTRGGHADVTMDDEHDAVREERESEVARVPRRLAEGKGRSSDPQSFLLSDTALEAEVDDMNHLEARFPYDQDEDAYNDDDDAGSASNESEEPLFHLPARIGRRIDDGAPKSKASKFYFFGPRRATLSRPASGVLPMAPSSSSLGSLAGHGHGSVADLSAIPPGKIVGKGRGGHGSSASMTTYSAVVRGGAGEAAATSTMTATTTHNNHKRNVLGKRKSSAVASPPGRAKRSDGRDGCGKRAEEEESEEERGHTSAFAPAALEAVESKKRKADIQAFVQVFLRAFFVTVIAQVRLQSATNDGVSHLSPGGAPTSLPSPPSPSSSAQVQAHQQPAQLLSPVEVCALLFLQRHFLSFKEVVERYVMHSDQEVVRRSAQAIFGDTLCAGTNHRRTAELDRKGTEEEEEEEDTDKTLASHPRPRTSPSLASSAIGTPSAPPSYRDALTANTKAKPPMEPLILDVDGEEESLDKMRKDGLAHREKTEKPPPPADLLMDSDLLHTILSPDNVAALRQLSEQQRQQQQQQHGRKNTMTPSQQNEEEEEEEEPYCETDDVEPLSIDQLYLSGKDAAWQPLLLDALGITRVLQCYPETTNMQRVNNSNRNGNATAQESPNRLGQQQQQQQSVDVNLPPLGVAAGGGGGGGGIHSGSTLVSHQQVVLGALKAFLLKQTRPSHCETDSLANSSLHGDEEESHTYLHYLIPYLGSPEQQQEQQQPPNTLCGAGACVTSTEGVASRPSNDADKGAGVWPCSTSFHGLLDPLHWIPYAFLPSPYSTATSNYSTELFVAQLPVSGRLLYRWVIPAEDTDKYNLSVFFQSSLFSFLQGGPVPSPTTESGFLIDLQLRHHLHLQQQQQQYGERSSGSGSGGVVGRASVGVNRPPLLPSPASQRESTLVHCSAGMHRSSGMVIAFLLWLLYQCAQLTTTLTKHSEQQQGEAAGERWEGGKRENARAVAASQSATAIPDPMSASLFALFTTLLRQRPTSAEVGTDAPAAAATGADYRSNPLMTDASEVLVRAIKHVKQRRGVAEPIATVQYLLKHFAAELQLP